MHIYNIHELPTLLTEEILEGLSRVYIGQLEILRASLQFISWIPLAWLLPAPARPYMLAVQVHEQKCLRSYSEACSLPVTANQCFFLPSIRP